VRASAAGLWEDKRYLGGLLVLLMATAIVLQAAIDAEPLARDLSKKQASAVSGQVLVQLLGGLRTVAAAYLWIKVDADHHAYYDELSKEQSLIPLYRLMTWLVPHFVEPYFVASYMLYLYHRPREGLAFAKEGLANNPDSDRLHYNIGEIYLIYEKKYSLAARHLELAVDLAQSKDDRLTYLVLLAYAYRFEGNEKGYQRVVAEIRQLEQELGVRARLVPRESLHQH